MPRALRRIAPVLVLLLLLFQGRALALSPAHLAALKGHINANTNTIDYGGVQVAIQGLPQGGDAAMEIAKWYNGRAVPDFFAWRTSITEYEVTQQPSRTGTTFMWAGTGFISRSVGELTAWDRLFRLGCNPSLPAVRQAFLDIMSGAGNAASNRTHLDTVARRPVSWMERIGATGAGGDTSATAGLMTFEGVLTGTDVLQARELP